MSVKPNGSQQSAAWNPNTHYQDQNVATQYDAVRFSSLAGRVFNRLERDTIASAFSSLPAGARIADFPCGTGRLAEALLEASYKVHGMDISAEMLQVAATRLRRFGTAFTTEVCDARAVTFDHERYDGVLCARVLMHFPLQEQISFLQGVARLTRGPIVINHSYSSGYQRFRRGIKRVLKHQNPSHHPITDAGIKMLLSSCGLRETRRLRLNSLVSEAVYLVTCPVS